MTNVAELVERPAQVQRTGLILCYDTETDSLNNPRLVQLACCLIEQDGTERAHVSMIVRPEGFTISDEVARIHGVTHDLACRVGLPARVAVAAFLQLRAVAGEAVAHNEEFDHRVIENELRHLGVAPSRPWPACLCTAQGAVAAYVGLPPTQKMLNSRHRNKNKTPTLMELHRFLFDEGFSNAHDARFDMRALVRCFVELRKRMVI